MQRIIVTLCYARLRRSKNPRKIAKLKDHFRFAEKPITRFADLASFCR
jgi:hypothetical protein